MTRIEYQKEFLDGHLKGIKIVEAIYTDFPESFYEGKVYKTIENNTIRINHVVAE